MTSPALFPIAIRDTEAGATFAVSLHPGAHLRGARPGQQAAITGTLGDSLKVAVSAPPIEGRANDALRDLFSELLDVPRSAVQLIAGERSRNKVLRIAGCTAAEVEKSLRRHFRV